MAGHSIESALETTSTFLFKANTPSLRLPTQMNLLKLWAGCFDVALKAKLRTSLAKQPSVGGLENLLCNDVLLDGAWSTDAVWRWKKPLHINIQETLTVVHLLKSLAVAQPKSRPVIVMDSNVGLSALVKGRSPSRGLRKALRKAGATTIVGALYPGYHYGPTRMLPADHPTRDHGLQCWSGVSG